MNLLENALVAAFLWVEDHAVAVLIPALIASFFGLIWVVR